MVGNKNFPKFVRIAALTSSYKLQPFILGTEGNKTKYILDLPLISILSQKFSFKYDLLQPADQEFGRILPGGNWTGLVGMLHRGEADIAIGRLFYSDIRATVANFSLPYQYAPVNFITAKPRHVSDPYAIVHPFSFSVWIAIILTLMLVQFISRIFKSYIKKYSFEVMLFNVFGSLLEKSLSIEFNYICSKLLIWSWIIGAMFITFSYKAVLLAFLTFPSLVGIQNIQELSKATEDSSFKCSVYIGTRLFNEILAAGDENSQKIGRCLERSNMYTDNVTDFLEDSTHQKAYLGARSHLKTFYKTYFVSDESFFNMRFHIAFRTSFCCKEMVNNFIDELQAYGILQKLDSDMYFFLQLKEKGASDDGDSSNRKLSLEDILGAVVILVFGHVFAIVVLLLEVLHSKKSLK